MAAMGHHTNEWLYNMDAGLINWITFPRPKESI